MTTARVFTKRYSNPATLEAAVRHYRWLARYAPPLRLPALLGADPATGALYLERIPPLRPFGRADLHQAASQQGHLHACILAAHPDWTLTTPQQEHGTVLLADFATPRRAALHARLHAGQAPDTWLTPAHIDQLLAAAVGRPACIYKDSNLRNLLVTAQGLVTVDVDDLTLAPPGYDLAKLLCSWAMTHGPLAAGEIAAVLERYNIPLPTTARCPLPVLYVWLECHHLLTAPYLGRAGYQHSWATTRPAEAAELFLAGLTAWMAAPYGEVRSPSVMTDPRWSGRG